MDTKYTLILKPVAALRRWCSGHVVIFGDGNRRNFEQIILFLFLGHSWRF